MQPGPTGESREQDEVDVLGARVSGALGRISLPRTVVGQLIALSSWFCPNEPRTIVQEQIVGGRWVRAFHFRRELTVFNFSSFWDWVHPEGRRGRAHRTLLSESMVDDIPLAILSVSDLRAKISPLVVATDASEWGLGVSRTSSSTAQGRVALQDLPQTTPSCSGSVGLVELFAGMGGLLRAMEHCGVFPALHVAVEEEAATQRVLQASWSDVQLVHVRVADLSNDTLPEIVGKRPHVRIWIVGASLPPNLLAAHQEIPRLVSLLKQLVCRRVRFKN